MTELLLDSVILIDHFNGWAPATRFLLDIDPRTSFVSVITRTEILVGFEVTEVDAPKSLLDQFSTLEITKKTADQAAVLRREHGWKLSDAFQAALSLEHKLQFVTRNTKDFDPSRHPFVQIPYQI